MQRKTKSEKVERLRRRDNDLHRILRRKCLRFANDNRAALAAIEPQAPPGLDDRAFDIWEPLLAIAQHVGGGWLKLATEAATALSGGEEDSEETRVELLHDIENEFARTEGTALATKTLIDRLCADEERPWATYSKNNKDQRINAKQIAQLLGPFDIISGTVRPHETGEAKDAKGYRRAWFESAFERYPRERAPRLGDFLPSSRPSSDEMGTSSGFCSRPETGPDGSKKCEKPANHGQMDGWTGKPPISAAHERFAPVCEHCGAPATASSPVQLCAVNGEEYVLHPACQNDWQENNGSDR